LKNNNQSVKHVNALLVSRERRNQNITQKTDTVDATCAARVLLARFAELPDAEPADQYWVLRTLVAQRDLIVRNKIALKNHLHDLLMHHYPNYRAWFPDIDSKTSLAFLARYPSPGALAGVSLDELTDYFKEASQGKVGAAKAKLILDTLQEISVPFQELRDQAVQSVLRQIESGIGEEAGLDKAIAGFMDHFACTLTSMSGINTVSAAQILACIGDIRQFATPAKLARYAGIAPVTYASGKTETQYANSRGNRELNAVLYLLAVRLIMAPRKRVVNAFFREYYHRKVSEGKTKRQALKCVQRRLVNIIWGMLTYGRAYENPDACWVEKEEIGQNQS
jgi:transposase